MNKVLNINNLFKNINENNLICYQIKIGNMLNNYFNCNIDKTKFNKIYDFYHKKYQKYSYSYKKFEYIDLCLINNNNNFYCYKNINLDYKYIYYNNIVLLVKNNLYIDVDNIYFPKNENIYHENIESNYFLIKFKNSILRIEFLNINNKYNSIILKIDKLNNSLDELEEIINKNLHNIYSYLN